MKSITIGLVATMLIAGPAIAQETASTSVTFKKLEKEEVPTVIMASVEKDFPERTMEEIALIPGKAYTDEWAVTEETKTAAQNFIPDYYTVSLGGKNTHGEAVYNRDGELLHYKEVIKNELLPRAIRTKISEEYPGYAELATQEVVRDGKQHTDYYKVRIRKGKDKETLYFNEDGKLFHHKKEAKRNS